MAKAQKTVAAREANQHFSRLLARAQRGETITITKYGAPVARLAPGIHPPLARTKRQRDAAVHQLIALLRKGLPLGGVRVNRDEIYDRWQK